MKIKLFTIPNMLTLLNLLLGCAATLFAMRFDDIRVAFYMIAAAAVVDFLDGFAARLLKSSSEIGKQLDSLADMVSFGVAPSAILLSMFLAAGGNGYAVYAVFILAMFSALRLAKFNIDKRQSENFIGLPTPAAAIFVGSSGYLYAQGLYVIDPYYIIGITIVLSYFLVSEIPMFSLKFKTFGLKENFLRYAFIAASAAAVIIWGVTAVPFIIMAYITVSVIRQFAHS